MPCHWVSVWCLFLEQPVVAAWGAMVCAFCRVLPVVGRSQRGCHCGVGALLSPGVIEARGCLMDPAGARMACARGCLCAVEWGGLYYHGMEDSDEQCGCAAAVLGRPWQMVGAAVLGGRAALGGLLASPVLGVLEVLSGWGVGPGVWPQEFPWAGAGLPVGVRGCHGGAQFGPCGQHCRKQRC